MLGSVEALRDGQAVALEGRKARALLGLLLLHPNEVVPSARIVDALWGFDPPPTVDASLRVAVAKLRRGLEPVGGRDAVETHPAGYRIRVEPDQLDWLRVRQSASAGARLLEEGRTDEALEQLETAQQLWRGTPLGELAPEVEDSVRVGELLELRLSSEENRLDCLIRLGRHREAVPDLLALAAQHPSRERLTSLLMLGLYRSGRQEEALAAFRATSSHLREEMGLDPGLELRELEQRILRQDPSLDRTARLHPDDLGTPGGRSRRRQAALVVLLAAVAGVVVLGLVVATHRGDAAPVPAANSVLKIDPATNRVVDSIPVGRLPGTVMAARGSVWVANDLDRTLSHVDTDTRAVKTIGGVSSVGFLARDERGNVYASAFDHPLVWRIDPATDVVVGRYRVGTRAVGIAVGGGSLWAVDRLNNTVVAFDLQTGKRTSVVEVGLDPIFTSFGYGSLWVANSDEGTVSVIAPGKRRPETILVARPMGIAVGDGAIWVASPDATITRIDPDTRRVIALVQVDEVFEGGMYHVAAGASGVWATDENDQDVVRVDPRTNRVVAHIHLQVEPRGIAVTPDAVWVAVAEPGTDY